MADVATKQQTTTLFLSTIVIRKRRHTELTKYDNPSRKPVLYQRSFSSVFRALFYAVKLHSLTWSVWGPLDAVLGILDAYLVTLRHITALPQDYACFKNIYYV